MCARAFDAREEARHELTLVSIEIECVTDAGVVARGHRRPVRVDVNATREPSLDGQVGREPAPRPAIAHRHADLAAQVVLGVAGHVHAMNPTLGTSVILGLHVSNCGRSRLELPSL